LVRETQRGLTDLARTPAWFDVTKRVLATSLLRAEEAAPTRAANLARSAVLAGEPSYLRSMPGRTVRLSAEALLDYARKYLDRARAHSVLVRPMAADATDAKSAAAAPSGDDVAGEPVKPSVEPATARGWMRAPGFGSAYHGKLTNGMEVVVVPRQRAPFHTAVLAFHGGSADVEARGVNIAAGWALARFAQPWSWGRWFETRIEPDLTEDVMRASGSDAAVTLEQLRAVNDNLRVTWPPRQFTQRLSVFRKEDEAPPSVLSRKLKAALYGSHRYGRAVTTDDILRITPNDIQEFLNTVRRPDSALLVLVGDFKPEAVVAAAEQKLGGLARPQTHPLRAPQPALERAQAAAGSHILVQQQAGLSNVDWRWQCVLPPATAETAAAGAIFAQVLQNALHRELRERVGSSYQVSQDVLTMRGGTTVLSLRADVDYAYLKPVLATVRGFVESQPSSFLDENRVARAREDVARLFNSGFDDTRSIAQKIVSAWNLGWPLETWDKYPDRVFQIDSAEITKAADQCRGNWAMGLLGDGARIRAALADWNP
jgi:predicted Zn-dependent peptidase